MEREGTANGVGLILNHPTQEAIMSLSTEKPTNTSAVRPFTIDVPQADLKALQARVAATRWPDKETVADHSQGVQLETIKELARYWAAGYDWRNCEAKLNSLPQFMSELEGLDIHFIHVRSKHEEALPLIVTHGWPGSVIEQLKIIDPLTNPTAYGASAADAFHVVVPSMPGYGFSAKPIATGWGPARIARAWATLMERLGYTQFVAQGGDWGGLITEVMGAQAPPGLVGVHTNFPGTVPPDVEKAIQIGDPPSPDFSAAERRAYLQLQEGSKQRGNATEMGTRPQTLSGLADSPVALASWMLDHDGHSEEQLSRAIVDGQPFGAITSDDVLDNITLYWLTNTGVSSARLYWENKFSFFGVKNVSVPIAVSVFPGERYQAPRSWAEKAYSQLIYFNELDRGGHFAAWEQPQLLSEEVRAGFRSLR